MIGQTVSHYRILEKLGEGGMGAVYLAEDTHLGRRVAIKFPSEAKNEHHFRARFLREARAASTLSHPNIATIYDYGETADGQPFIVMELVEGKPLSELMRAGDLTLGRAVEIIEDVAAALGEAHARGIIHRDIKPSNIVLDGRDRVKVLDFGLAKQLHEEHAHSADPDARTLLATRTESGVVIGTPLYLSPEQAKGQPVDSRSDLFALGAVLYECLSGHPAFSGTTVVEIAANVLHLNPLPPSSFHRNVPAELDRVALKALAKKPSERYQSAAEFREALGAARAELPEDDDVSVVHTRRIHAAFGNGHTTSALATLSDIFRRPRLSLGLALTVLVIAGLAVWLVVRATRAAPHQPTPEAARWYEAGTNALRDGAYYQASKALEQSVAADDSYPLAHARLAEALMELDYVDRAKDELLRVASLAPDRSTLEPLDALYLDAVTAAVRRDFAVAVAAYGQITRLTPNSASAYVDLGRAYENNEELKKAIESYQEATRRDQRYATAYLRLGTLYGRQQELQSARVSFDKAEEIYQAAGSVEGRAEVFYQRGVLLRGMGKIGEARPALQTALDLASAASNQSQQIKVLLELSYITSSEGDMGQAQQYAAEAVDLAQSNGMENLATRGLVDLGNVFLVRGDYDEAEKYYRQAMDLARKNKAKRNEARAFLMLGSLRVQQGRASEAVTFVRQALPFYQQGGYRKETSQALLLLGRANRQYGNYAAALEAYQQQLQVAEQLGDPSQLALSHEGMATVYSLQDRFPEALDNYEKKYEISKSTNDQKGMAYGLAGRGYVLAKLGRYADARSSLEQAASLANRPDGGMKALAAQIYLTEAEMLLSQRRFPEARAKAEQAIKLAGTQYQDVALGAKRVTGAVQTGMGAASDAIKTLSEVAEAAERTKDLSQISTTSLALADAMLESGADDTSLIYANRAQEGFARARQPESEWRAWVLVARAARRAGDENRARQAAARAADLLAGFQQKWGEMNYNSYLARPDVQHLRKQLGEEFGLNR